MTATFYIARELPDKLLQQIQATVAELKSWKTAHALISTSVSQANFAANLSVDASASGFDEAFARFKAHPALQITSFVIEKTTKPEDGPRIKFDAKFDDVADLLTIEREAQDKDLEVLDAVGKVFEFVDRKRASLDQLPPLVRDNLTAHADTVLSLEQHVARLGEFVTGQIQRNEEHLNHLTSEIDSRYRQREAELERQYGDKQKALDVRDEVVREKEAEFDIRESRGVRRALLANIETLLEKQCEVKLSAEVRARSDNVLSSSSWVIVFGFLLAIGTIAAITISQTCGTAGSFSPWIFAPILAASSVLTITTLVYRLKFAADGYRVHAETELANQKFRQDILRASWLAELLFEAATKDDARGREVITINDQLLGQLAKGLFEYNASAKSAKHPIEELQQYARQFKKLTVGPVQIENKDDPKHA